MRSRVRYVFTAFTNDSESNMYVYESADATTFTLLHGPAYEPPTGLVRDPSVIRHGDRWIVAHTTGWETGDFALAVSDDLAEWRHHTTVEVGAGWVRNTWAPEFFRDPATGRWHVVVSLSTDSYGPFRPHLFTAEDAELTRWSGPVELAGIGPNHIDTFLVHHAGEYHAFAKNETDKVVEHAVAPALTGPYRFVDTGDFAGWGRVEGPALTVLPDGRYRIYLDGYTTSRYVYSDSADLRTWTPPRELPGGLSGFVRHGSVFREE
ncbi:family 43 glycosylhydrolase [Actinoalloteichus spitiensis]|uniref:family 43 glycosylhydrolase n=1 Tax=Actinoalloteichus spitiensis TaxID=252394 RepID=UPI000A0016B9|nr:family 43 glycosylhydrolase [Actinoalloteichus spitiensis]